MKDIWPVKLHSTSLLCQYPLSEEPESVDIYPLYLAYSEGVERSYRGKSPFNMSSTGQTQTGNRGVVGDWDKHVLGIWLVE